MIATVCRSRKLFGAFAELRSWQRKLLVPAAGGLEPLLAANRIDPIRDGSNREESRNGDRYRDRDRNP